MPRNGLGMPITSSSVGGAVINVDDVLWESFGSNEIAINYAENYTNIILHSQDTTDAEAWTKTNTAIDSTLYEAPDNSTTANAIKSSSTGQKNYKITQSNLSVTAGKTYTVSVHLKKENLGFARLKWTGGTARRTDFNLTTGAVTNTSNVIRTQVDAMDDDWFRCSITFVATTSSGSIKPFAQLVDNDGTPNIAVSGIVLIYVWGFQLEENIEASPYIVTTTEARTATETLNDLSSIWDFDSANLMPEADPDSEGVWEVPANIVLNGDYEELGSEKTTNGTFTTDSDWTNEISGWTISNGKANYSGVNPVASFQQNISLSAGKIYKVTYTISNRQQGDFRILLGNTAGTINNSDGTYTEYITYSSGSLFYVQARSSFIGSIDNVSVKQVDPNDRWTLGTGWSIEDGKAKCDGSQSAGTQLTQDMTLGNGSSYEVTFTLESISAGNVDARFQGSGSTVTGTSRTSAGTYTEIITSTGNTSFRLRGNDAFVGVIDNVTVREHAIQPLDV